ncbi:MAG: chromate efflux transporter [Sandaracinus sp.]
MTEPSAPLSSPPPEHVSFGEALRVWTKIGLLSFGGPAGQIATMHRELVEKRRWVDEPRFLHALGYCMLLPGPEAQQLATYLGWMMHRTPGALAAGTLFILPGFVAILALSIAYATLGQLPLVAGLFFGLKCAVLAMVVDAARRIGLRVLRTTALRLFALAAFVAIFFFDVPFPIVIVLAALTGLLVARFAPSAIPSPAAHGEGAHGGPSLLDRMAARGELAHTRPSWRRALVVLVTGLALWSIPFVLALVLAPSPIFLDEATFFSGTAMITFGGAYAVLAYVAQRAVHDFGWLGAREMIDGLALAETTPGPLIMVVELVGFLGAFHHPGSLSPLVAGTLGAIVTVWVTFVPCFLWILLGGPYIEALREVRAIQHALTGVTAAVVGVIANLSLWFATHVIFAEVRETAIGPLRLLVPELASLDALALALSAAAIAAVTFTKLGPMRVLGIAAAIGLVLRGALGL